MHTLCYKQGTCLFNADIHMKYKLLFVVSYPYSLRLFEVCKTQTFHVRVLCPMMFLCMLVNIRVSLLLVGSEKKVILITSRNITSSLHLNHEQMCFYDGLIFLFKEVFCYV